MARFSQESQPYKMRLTSQRNKEFEEWLVRSLVCTTVEPRDLATLSSAIFDGFGQCSKICALSSFKFLLAFLAIGRDGGSTRKSRGVTIVVLGY